MLATSHIRSFLKKIVVGVQFGGKETSRGATDREPAASHMSIDPDQRSLQVPDGIARQKRPLPPTSSCCQIPIAIS